MTLSSPAFARASRFRHGINLSHWFSQVYWAPGYTTERFDSYITAADFALIRDMGFDHVRLPINCEPMIIATTANGMLPRTWIDRIRARVAEIHDHGLGVIIDIHPEDPFKHTLANSTAAVGDLIAFWTRFATELRELDPERTLFEVLNEPCIHDADRWHQIQRELVAAVRAVAPRHTIVVTGDKWSLCPELLELELPADDNLIANFHLYEPHAFSHQGAHWIGEWATNVTGLTYPASADNVNTLAASITNEEARAKLAEYLHQNWNAETYRQFVRPAAEWAAKNNVPLMCNEFGVYQRYSPRDSRLSCVHDVATALEEAGIGWTMWDYAGDFTCIKVNAQGIRESDHKLIAALGLTSSCIINTNT